MPAPDTTFGEGKALSAKNITVVRSGDMRGMSRSDYNQRSGCHSWTAWPFGNCVEHHSGETHYLGDNRTQLRRGDARGR